MTRRELRTTGPCWVSSTEYSPPLLTTDPSNIHTKVSMGGVASASHTTLTPDPTAPNWTSRPSRMDGGPRRATLALRDTGEGEEGEVTVQVYRPAVRLDRLKLRTDPRPTVTAGAALRVHV